MFQNKSSTMPLRSRIPARKAGAGISDENNVGTVAARLNKDAEHGVPATKLHTTVTGIPSVAGAAPALSRAGVAKVFGAPAPRAVVPAKVFGVQVARAAVRPRAAFGDASNIKPVGGVAAKLTKPEEVAARINGKPATRIGRVVLGAAVAKPVQATGRSRLPVITARPASAATRSTAAILGSRPIVQPAAAFGARRAVAVKATDVAPASKRARSAVAAVPAPTSVLGKHTRSGRVARASSAESCETASTLAPSSDGATPESSASASGASTAVPSSEPSPAVSGSSAFTEAQLAELKFVESDTIDYALAHTGLSSEVPITMAEINEFEADVNPTDTSVVPEFSDDIFGYMRELEVRLMPNPKYIELQPALRWSTRAALIEWVVQVHDRFGLLPESLYLAVNFIDRFLSTKEVAVDKLQLVGAVCLLLATKYEEIHVPSVKDIEYMVEENYKVKDILAAERYVLRMLDFDMGWPGPLSFLRRISKADLYDPATRTLAKYMMEVTLMDERFIGVPCSKIAAIAHYLAMRFLDKGPWTRAHAFYAGYFESELMPYARVLIRLLMEPLKHRAIYDKYAQRQYMRGSEFVLQWFRINDVKYLLSSTHGDLAPRTHLPPGADELDLLPPF